MIRKLITTVVTGSLLMLPLQQAFAHGGGLDRHGCHRETATNTRHCHRKDDEGSGDLLLILGGVAAGLVLVAVLLRNRNNPALVENLELRPDLDPQRGRGLAAEYSLDRFQHLGVRMVSKPEEERPTAYVGAYWKLKF